MMQQPMQQMAPAMSQPHTYAPQQVYPAQPTQPMRATQPQPANPAAIPTQQVAQMSQPVPAQPAAQAPNPEKAKQEEEYWKKHTVIAGNWLVKLKEHVNKPEPQGVSEETLAKLRRNKAQLLKMAEQLEEKQETHMYKHAPMEDLLRIEKLFMRNKKQQEPSTSENPTTSSSRAADTPRRRSNPFGSLVAGVAKLEKLPTDTALKALGQHVRMVWENLYSTSTTSSSRAARPTPRWQQAALSEDAVIVATPSGASKRNWAATIDRRRLTADGEYLSPAAIYNTLLAHQDSGFWPAKADGDAVILEEGGGSQPRQVRFVFSLNSSEPSATAATPDYPRILLDGWKGPGGAYKQAELLWQEGDSVHNTLAFVKSILQMLRSTEVDVAALDASELNLTFECQALSARGMSLLCSCSLPGALPKLLIQQPLGTGSGKLAPAYTIQYLRYAKFNSGKELDDAMAANIAALSSKKQPTLSALLECWRLSVQALICSHKTMKKESS